MDTNVKSVAALLAVVLAGFGIAVAGSQGGAGVSGIPVFALCVGLAFAVQWLAFIPAYLMHSERFYDLTGGLTYICVATLALLLSPPIGARSMLLVALVVIWAARLSTFLFRRVVRAGKDDRFEEIKASFLGFLNAWNTQGLWISFTLAAALAAITSTRAGGIDAFAIIGLFIWIAGFSIEAVADAQKRRFRADPANKSRYIHTGLWSWSRHPNYFGEITLWTGVAIIALPVLQGWQWVTLLSPVFVFLLITRVSGVPILEKRADAKWGGEADYLSYKARTSVLVPLPPRADAK